MNSQKSWWLVCAAAALVMACPPPNNPVCGNGKVEDAEQCDDGNSAADDGCENDCTVTPGFDGGMGGGSAQGGGSAGGGSSGGGVAVGGGSNQGGGSNVGGGSTTGGGSNVGGGSTTGGGTGTPMCNNGIAEGTEACDDGNMTPGDGCENDCTLTATTDVQGCAGQNAPVPTGATCAVTPGDGNTLITGTVLAPDKTWVGGQVLVDSTGVITCVGCDCTTATGGSTATRVTCPQGVVSPGLINSHDHISYQGNPAISTDERYEHRHDWRVGNDGHTRVNNGGNASNAQIRWAEVRQVMAGTTSIVGATYSAAGNQGMLRNLDSSGVGQLGLNLAGSGVNSDTFPLGDTPGVELTTSCAYPKLPSAASIPAGGSWLPHVAEGIELSAENEFKCISAIPNVLGTKTSLVHGVGLKASEVGQVALTRTSLVWSPRSNVSLYGDTATISVYKKLGVTIALGTDWTISGSMNLLRELKCADSLNTTRFGRALSDKDLWLSVTGSSADATTTADKIGRLQTSKVGDIAIFKRSAAGLYRSIIDAQPADVVMTMRGGKVLYGEVPLVNAFDTTSSCETLDVCGSQRALCLKSEFTTALTGTENGQSLASLQRANMSTYPLFSCTTPNNEPSCVPQRAARNVRNNSGVYTVPPAGNDADGDGIADAADNCPGVFNPIRPMDNGVQADGDRDSVGDACDPCPLDANTTTCGVLDPNDLDGDLVPNAADNCPNDPNPSQTDGDSDGKGDTCDACPTVPNPGAMMCPATIYSIKSGSSPAGQPVALGNVLVTGVAATGFFVQVHESETGYMGPNFSGIFAFKASPGVAVGDRVSMPSVTPALFNGQLQLNAVPSVGDGGMTIDSSGNLAPAPIDVADPGDLASNDGGLSAALEGVLVRVNNVTVLNNAPDAGPGDRAPINEFVVTGGLRVNDLLYLATPFPSNNQSFSSITGVLEWRNGNYKLEPRSAADFANGPAVIAALEPAQVFVREGSSTVLPSPLQVRMSNPEGADYALTVTASDAGVLVGDGGVIVVAANQLTSPIPLTGVTADPAITITATRGTSSKTAQVRVLGAMEPSRLVALEPATGTVLAGGTLSMKVRLDLPAAQPQTVTLALTTTSGGTFGTVPATVTIAQDTMEATFALTADVMAMGNATVTATLGADMFTATVTAAATNTDHIVISEVAVAGPNGAGDEFIELYNPTGAAIDISGWRLQYRSATGTTWSLKATMPANTSIGAHRYFLVGATNYRGTVTPDFTPGAIDMAAAAGHIRLVDDSAAPVEIDKLGYGQPGNVPVAPEGMAILATLASNGSFERKANPSSTATTMSTGGADELRGNAADTNDNSADFVARAVRDPQSLASGVTEP